MITDDEFNQMRREFLMNRDLDADTRSKIALVAFVLERQAEADGDPDAGKLYVAFCWHLSQPENRDELERAYRELYPEAIAILSELEEGG